MTPLSAFWYLSLPHLAEHKLRTTLTVLGITLGVGAMIGLRMAYEPISRSFERTIEGLAGRAVLQISNGGLGVPEEVVDEVREVSGVAVATPTVQGFLPLLERPGERVYVLGIDLVNDQNFRDYRFADVEGMEDPLLFLAQADSVAVTKSLMEELQLNVGDRVRLLSPSGPVELTVRAALDARSGPASLFGGRLAVMDVFAAQRVFRLDRRFTQVDLSFLPDVDIGSVESRLTAVLKGRAHLEPQRASIEGLERLVGAQRRLSTLHAFGAAMVGVTLIYNTMMISVVQRRRQLAILRSIGMRRVQVIRFMLVEALALGIVGCALGVLLGLVLARVMTISSVVQLGSALISSDIGQVKVNAEPIVIGIVLGLSSALVATLAPAIEAVKIQPLEALRPSEVREASARYWKIALLGVGIELVTLVVWVTRGSFLDLSTSAHFVQTSYMIGISLIVPFVMRIVGRRFQPLLARVFRTPGLLASRTLASNMDPFATTGTVFVMCFAYAILFSAAYSTLKLTFETWFESMFGGADLVVSAGALPMAEDSVPLVSGLADEIRALDGVTSTGVARFAPTRFAGAFVTVMATDSEWRRTRVAVIKGNTDDAREQLQEGKGVLVDEAFESNFHLGPGDSVALASLAGEVKLPILGVTFTAREHQAGTVVIDRDRYRELWNDDSINLIQVVTGSAAAKDAVARAIRARWGEQYRLFVTSVGEFREELEGQVRRDLAGIPPILVIAVTIALLGLINSLFASVLDRTRQIGVVRAVGGTRRQVSQAILLEGVFVGVIGGVLAGVVGSFMGYYELSVFGKAFTGITLVYDQPVGIILLVVLLATGLAAGASYFPGRSAASLTIVEALDRD